jgi:O-antigen biosynthesis protein WbqV
VNGSQDESPHLLALGELMGRPPKAFDQIAVRRLIRGRRVLVTGAGGSIGAELVRQIAGLSPGHLTLVDNSEFGLYAIDQYLRDHRPELSRQAVLCDIRDRYLVESWFAHEAPEVVFHAAALKHVPMSEDHPIEAVRTNILGTQNVADACAEHGVDTMVFVSTDKAVNPLSVMGATKRCAEAYCQALDIEGSQTRFVSVRFGNVLGSSGSVVPLFQRQIAEGGPITLTHLDVSRYFMTLAEAVSLLLQAATLRETPDTVRGAVHVMDIGEPIRIADLARMMIRMAGRRPDEDIELRIVGLRPGEKLHEELVHPDEARLLRTPSGLTLAGPRTGPLSSLRDCFARMADAAVNLDGEATRDLIREIVPEYVPGGMFQPRLPALVVARDVDVA